MTGQPAARNTHRDHKLPHLSHHFPIAPVVFYWTVTVTEVWAWATPPDDNAAPTVKV